MKLNEAARLLSDGGIEDAKREARLLFSHFLGVSPALLLTENYESDNEALISAVRRRCDREPLQYIFGEAYFYRERYKVRPGCLIPREDTEVLVDFAVKHIPKGEGFIDLCTGSGCVAVSVLCNTENTTAVAVDICADALDIARENAELNGVLGRVEFALRDAMIKPCASEKYFALISNPPYVTHGEYLALAPELYREPKIAFVGGEDGGDFYRAIVPNYKKAISPRGFMAFEIGKDQGALLRLIAEENGMSCEILRDLSHNDRVAVLRYTES